MPDPNFQIEGVEAIAYAAVPLLAFKVRITNAPADETVHTVVLRAQIQIDVARRRYTPTEQARLLDLFGTPERWSQTLRSLLWTHASAVVPHFQREIRTDVTVPCTFDFNVATTKYFYALDEGNLPLIFLFSGTVFYDDGGGLLRVAPISWEKEAKFNLPVRTWRELMDLYYPNSAWLSLRKDVFDKLYQYKMRSGAPTWEQAVEKALSAGTENVRP